MDDVTRRDGAAFAADPLKGHRGALAQCAARQAQKQIAVGGKLDRAGVQQFLSAVEQGHDGRRRNAAGVEVGRILHVASGERQLDIGDQLLRGRWIVGEKSDNGQKAVFEHQTRQLPPVRACPAGGLRAIRVDER